METSSKSAKVNYQATLQKRAAQVYDQCKTEPSAEARQQILLDALKATALESWKNGLDAGRRRAQSPKANRPTVTA